MSFYAYQISSQKAHLNVFIFIYFATALEGTVYNYRLLQITLDATKCSISGMQNSYLLKFLTYIS